MKKRRKGSLLQLPLRAYSRLGSWASRMVNTKGKQDTEFLPGALEVIRTPPSPTGRMILWAIILFAVISVLWACFSKIDVVAIAVGKIIPSGKAKVIQPADLGVIREIAVKEGQHVEEGDLLVSLDPTINEAEVLELRNQLIRAQCEGVLLNALQQWEPGSVPPQTLEFSEDISAALRLLYINRLEFETRAVNDNLLVLNSEIAKNKAHQANIRHQIEKQKVVLDIITKRAEAVKKLYAQKTVSEHDWLYQEEKRVGAAQDLASTMQEEQESLAAIERLKRGKRQTTSEFHRDVLQKKADNQNMIEALEQRLARAQQRNRLRRLTAPVAGEVQQLVVSTIGGVVKEAQGLMIIVPDSQSLEVEASIQNKDIGFVREGQEAAVKLEAFPYTEYGSIPGRVTSVSRDAVQDKEGNLTFLCRVKLDQDYILVNDQKVNLGPGMRATAEVAIRKRRLISYFLSPLMKYKTESLRER